MAGAQMMVIAQAMRAFGTIVHLEPKEFAVIVARIANPLVVQARKKLLFNKDFQYLIPYGGLVFYTESPKPLEFPEDTEFITAKGILVP